MKFNINSAYKKLKSYVYQDNTLLHLKISLARFESDKDFETKLSDLEKKLEKDDISEFDEYFSEVNYIIVPKTYNFKNNSDTSNIYSNSIEQNSYEVRDFNVFIDCPIELHLLSILWIMYIGDKLDSELSDEVLGYRLVRNNDGIFEKDDYKLFKKYHEKYSSFRDGAVKQAINLHKIELDCSVINLDIKRFFYNIKFDFDSIDIDDKYLLLNKILQEIHIKYQTKLLNDKIYKENEVNSILPIGLLSSSIIANHSLHKLDILFSSKLQVSYYARYVDDILLVFSHNTIQSMNKFIDMINCIDKEMSFTEKEDNISFEIENNKFTFQNDKIKIFEFKKDASIYLLNKFKKTIEQNRSIFNIMPETNSIFSTLEELSYNIEYSSTVNKISSVNDSKLDLLNISKNLSQMIRIVLLTNYSQDKINHYNKQLEELFTGANLFELLRLWEKLFSYLLYSNSFALLKEISIKIFKSIESVIYKEKEIQEKLQTFLINYYKNSLLIAVSLNKVEYKDFIENQLHSYTKSFYTKIYDLLNEQYLDISDDLLKSNLTKQYYISYPLINYCNKIDYKYLDKYLLFKDINFEIDKDKINLSPRFLHYHEILLFEKFNEKQNSKTNCEYIFNKYKDYNKKEFNKKTYPYLEENEFGINLLVVDDSSKLNSIKVGIAHLNIDINNTISSLQGRANLSPNRLDNIHKILNNALRTNCKMVVFPEISIPILWLKEIAEFSKRNDIAIIFGLEHFRIEETIYNYSMIILPFKDNEYKNVFIDFNLKSHYSPEEKKVIQGYGYKIPTYKEKSKVYRWKNIAFSVFNCFELTDIEYRAKLVGKNDITIAIEYNMDINYFSNIVGSISRDIHSYVIQVNNAKYGDSRITQPTSTQKLDILKIKGGEDIVLMTAEINIKSLREFQKKDYHLQKEDGGFKPTPPEFLTKCFKWRVQ